MVIPPHRTLDRLGEQFAGTHHVRFIDEDVPLHVIARVFQGRHLLRPGIELNSLVAGVVGRAQAIYAGVRLYAMAFMSNHVHFMLQGPPSEVPAFIGFVKREVSRRWGRNPAINWRGTMWHEYLCSALPTIESQVGCLKYILSQGTKEGLVARPQDWPGVHCARPLLEGRPLSGQWLNATGYSRAVDSEKRRKKPKRIRKDDYQLEYTVRFDTIPAWSAMSLDEQRREVRVLVDEIEEEARVLAGGRKPMGARAVCRIPLERRSELPEQPWFSRRRRMICWASPTAPETRAYISRYRAFQEAFRAASRAFAEHGDAVYPVGAFVPGRLKRAPQARPIAA